MDLLPIFQSLPPEMQQALAKDGFEAVKALASCIYKSCGQLLLPWQIKRVASAEAKAEEIKIQARANSIRAIGAAVSEYPALAIKYNGDLEDLNINNTDIQYLETRANIRLNHQNIRKQKNLESIVGKAYNELIDKKLETEEEVDEDWITRFFSTAEDISDEQVQTLWARILAGELLRPRTYSYRLLSILRNISKDELEIILKVAPLVCGKFIINEHTSLIRKGITDLDISILEDMGVLKDGGFQARAIELNCGDVKLFSRTDKLAFVFNNRGKNFINHFIDVFEITETGKKIFELSNVQIDIDTIKEEFLILFKDFPDLYIFSSEITNQEGNKVFFSKQHLFDINYPKDEVINK